MASAVLCTEPFQALGTAEATGLGLENLDMLAISHPLGGIKQEQVKEKAQRSVEVLEEKLLKRTPTEVSAN